MPALLFPMLIECPTDNVPCDRFRASLYSLFCEVLVDEGRNVVTACSGTHALHPCHCQTCYSLYLVEYGAALSSGVWCTRYMLYLAGYGTSDALALCR